MAPSKDFCGLCTHKFYGKQAFIRCGGDCKTRFHLKCLHIKEDDLPTMMKNGISMFKCNECLNKKVSDFPVLTKDNMVHTPINIEDASSGEDCVANVKAIAMSFKSDINETNIDVKLLYDLLRKSIMSMEKMMEECVNMRRENTKLIELVASKLNIDYGPQSDTGENNSQSSMNHQSPLYSHVADESKRVPMRDSLNATNTLAANNVTGVWHYQGRQNKHNTESRSKDVGPNPTVAAVSNPVQNTRTKKPVVTGTRVCKNLKTACKTNFVKNPGATPTQTLFLSRLAADTTVNELKVFLKVELDGDSFDVHKLRTKYNTYSSFHIRIPAERLDELLLPAAWPEGAFVSVFYGRLYPDQIYTDILEKSDITCEIDKNRIDTQNGSDSQPSTEEDKMGIDNNV